MDAPAVPRQAGETMLAMKRFAVSLVSVTLVALAWVATSAFARPHDDPVPARPPQATPFDRFAPSVKTRFDETWLYVECDGMPHAPFTYPLMVGIKSWQQQVPIPQAYTGNNAWQIPLKPELADDPVSGKTHLRRGAIAIAVNGVPIFNALNNRGDDAFLAGELDEHGGHAGRGDDYHYHIAPLELQKIVGLDQPIAYALDGFPLYGLFDSKAKAGTERSCALGGRDPLDELNGHFGTGTNGSRGLYHYHASKTYPYINGGMRGKVTVNQDEIDPQPHARPLRPALTPLRGAAVTGFKENGEKSWRLEYTIARKKFTVAYRLDASGKYIFEFTSPDGTKTTESFVKETGRGPGGDRPERRPPPRDQESERPPRRPPPPDEGASPPPPVENFLASFVLTSPAIGADGKLPATFTCDGTSESPPLSWTNPPTGTKSLALVMDHLAPDSIKSYWVVYGIPAQSRTIAANGVTLGSLGVNTVNGRPEYAPPCSNGPGEKKYTLTIYALSVAPTLAAQNVTREALLAAITDKTLATARLDVTYSRTQAKQANPPRIAADPPTPPPNFLFILVDDQAWNGTSVAMISGNDATRAPNFKTPNIEALAASGMTFSQAYAAHPKCECSRAAILTGRTTTTLNAMTRVSTDWSAPASDSIANSLKRCNPAYRAAHLGKWQWPQTPASMGYDISDGITQNDTGNSTDPNDPKLLFSMTRRAREFMATQVKEGHPFYLQMSYYAVHTTAQSLAETAKKYESLAAGGGNRGVRAGVAAMTEDLDTCVGALMSELRTLGIERNTYIIYMSDNGGRTGILSGGKGNLGEGGIRVPLIVAGPGVVGGSRCAIPVISYDILPTVLDFAAPHQLDGRCAPANGVEGGSWKSLLTHEGAGTVARSIDRFVWHQPVELDHPQSAIRKGDYKLVYEWDTKVAHLFDLSADLSEKRDLAAEKPEIATELQSELIAHVRAGLGDAAIAALERGEKPVPQGD